MRTNSNIRYLILFVTLVLMQVLFLDNINIHGTLNPFIYPLFILLLPLNSAHWQTIIAGFLIGIVIDIFESSPGIHAASSVFLGFVRPYILNLIKPKGGYKDDSSPSIKELGLLWFIVYFSVSIFLHHIVLFFTEIASVNNISYTIAKIILSSMFSILSSILTLYLFSFNSTKK